MLSLAPMLDIASLSCVEPPRETSWAFVQPLGLVCNASSNQLSTSWRTASLTKPLGYMGGWESENEPVRRTGQKNVEIDDRHTRPSLAAN
jgi:hypothetical protein